MTYTNEKKEMIIENVKTPYSLSLEQCEYDILVSSDLKINKVIKHCICDDPFVDLDLYEAEFEMDALHERMYRSAQRRKRRAKKNLAKKRSEFSADILDRKFFKAKRDLTQREINKIASRAVNARKYAKRYKKES